MFSYSKHDQSTAHATVWDRTIRVGVVVTQQILV